MAKELIKDYFIIEGVKYPFVPTSFRQVNKPQQSYYKTVANKAVVVDSGTNTSEATIRASARRVGTQVFAVTWNAMPRTMVDHIKSLFHNARAFYVQYDDEQSFDYERIFDVQSDRICFFTPTYPIYPYGYTPASPETFAGDVFISEGGTVNSLSAGFTVQQTLGAVLFDTQVTAPTEVFMRYTWRCPVLITGLVVQELDAISKNFYDVSLVMTQVPDSLVVEDLWKDTTDYCYIQSEEPQVTPTEEAEVPGKLHV